VSPVREWSCSQNPPLPHSRCLIANCTVRPSFVSVARSLLARRRGGTGRAAPCIGCILFVITLSASRSTLFLFHTVARLLSHLRAFYRDFRTLVSFRSALSRIEVTMSSLLLPTCRLSCGPFIAIICVSSAFPDPRAFHPGLWIALRPLQPFRGFPLAPILPRPPGPAPVCGSAVGRDPWCRDASPMFPTLKVPVFLYSVPVTCPPGRVGPTEGLPCGAPTLLCGLAGSPARARTLYLVL